MKTNYILHSMNGNDIATIHERGLIISNAQEFLDVIMEIPSDTVVMNKENLEESFFDLRSGLAGEILQRASNYSRRIGIVGDFSMYGSRSLKDFIRESNGFNKVVFADSVDEALRKLSA